MSFQSIDFSLLLPSLTVCVTGLLTMLLVPFLPERRQGIAAHISWIGLIIALYLSSRQIGLNTSTFGGQFIVDDFSQFFNLIFLLGSILTVFTSLEYLRRKENSTGNTIP